MLIDSFTKRAFYRQTGIFSFLANLTFEDNSGSCQIGFSGGTVLPFTFNSGRITDKSGYFFSPYNIRQKISFSGNVSSSGIDYFVNGEPKALGLPRETGYLDYFYINTSTNVELDIYINGEQPSYSYTNQVNYNTGDSSIPVTLTNNSTLPFRIFSGQLLSDSNLFSISGFPTGNINGTKTFYFNPNNLGGQNNLTVQMHTDFGPQVFTIGASGIVTVPETSVINLIGPPTIDPEGSGVYYCSFSNGSGAISVMPLLEYITGSGLYNNEFILTGDYSTTVTGQISGSGILSKTINISGSGYGGINNNYINIPFDYTATLLSYATGNFSWDFSILGTGLASNGSYTGPATGLITGSILGTILEGSGFYRYSGLVQLPPNSAYSSQATGRTAGTGLIHYNTPNLNDFLYVGNPDIALAYGISYTGQLDLVNYLNSNTGLHKVTAISNGGDIKLTSLVPGSSGNLPVFVDSSNGGSMSVISINGGQDLGSGVELTPLGNFKAFMNRDFLGTGIFSKLVSGLGTGLYSGLPDAKTFTGTWDMLTGLTIDSLVSVKSGGYFDTNRFSGTPYSAEVGSFYIYLPYTNPFPVADLIALTITGIGLPTGATVFISGNI